MATSRSEPQEHVVARDDTEQAFGAEPSAREPEPDADTPAALLNHAEGCFLDLKRAVAGYTTLTRALADHTKPAGRRQKGLPIMHFTGSADGVHAIEVVSDMSRRSFDKKYVQHALAPHINAFRDDMCARAVEIKNLMERLLADHFGVDNEQEAK